MVSKHYRHLVLHNTLNLSHLHNFEKFFLFQWYFTITLAFKLRIFCTDFSQRQLNVGQSKIYNHDHVYEIHLSPCVNLFKYNGWTSSSFLVESFSYEVFGIKTSKTLFCDICILFILGFRYEISTVMNTYLMSTFNYIE